jgi:hypothetical protein
MPAPGPARQPRYPLDARRRTGKAPQERSTNLTNGELVSGDTSGRRLWTRCVTRMRASSWLHNRFWTLSVQERIQLHREKTSSRFPTWIAKQCLQTGPRKQLQECMHHNTKGGGGGKSTSLTSGLLISLTMVVTLIFQIFAAARDSSPVDPVK